MKLFIFCVVVTILTAIIGIATSCNGKPESIHHSCIDKSHQRCDGLCECDGLGCYEDYKPNGLAVQYIPAREYQLDLQPDSIILFEGNRYVGTLSYDAIGQMDSLLMMDNQ